MTNDKETLTVRIDIDIANAMRQEAKELGISLNSYINATSNLGRKIFKTIPQISLDIPR